VPLLWAKSTGGQGVVLILLAERRGNAEMAKLAVQKIEAAFTTSRDGGDALSTSNATSPQQERTEPSGNRPCRHGVRSSLRREPDVRPEFYYALYWECDRA
jgi:hypothetical protein